MKCQTVHQTLFKDKPTLSINQIYCFLKYTEILYIQYDVIIKRAEWYWQFSETFISFIWKALHNDVGKHLNLKKINIQSISKKTKVTA